MDEIVKYCTDNKLIVHFRTNWINGVEDNSFLQVKDEIGRVGCVVCEFLGSKEEIVKDFWESERVAKYLYLKNNPKKPDSSQMWDRGQVSPLDDHWTHRAIIEENLLKQVSTNRAIEIGRAFLSNCDLTKI
jgi:hypothetical protein